MAAPTANAGPDQTVTIADETGETTVTLDGSASTDDGTITDYTWTLGSQTLASGASATADVDLPEGVHTIQLEVTDDEVLTDTDTVVITVKPKIRTYLHVEDATDTEYTIPFDLSGSNRQALADQVRILKKDGSGDVTELIPQGRLGTTAADDYDYTVSATAVTLEQAYSGEELVIFRETQMNKPWVTLTPGARVRGDDRNLRGDQILYVAQELREIRDIADILGSGVGEPFEYDSTPFDQGLFSQQHQGDGTTTAFSYSLIEMLPVGSVQHDSSMTVFVDGALQLSGYTVDEDAVTVIFDTAPADEAEIILRRKTRIDRRWVQHRDATTFSSMLASWDESNIEFVVEETPGFPTFLADNPLNNRIFPRIINEVLYSGPGNRFFFGNLPWFGNGEVFVFNNDVLLDPTDYDLDFLFFTINFVVEQSGPILIQTTTPGYAFFGLPFAEPNDAEPVEDEEEDTVVTETGTMTVAARYQSGFDELLAETQGFFIGDGTGGDGESEPQNVCIARSGTLGAGFPGSSVTSATITIANVTTNTSPTNTIHNVEDDYGHLLGGGESYNTLFSKFRTATADPSIPGATTGEITIDVTELFQLAAAADDTEVFLALVATFNATLDIEFTGVITYSVTYDTGAASGSTTVEINDFDTYQTRTYKFDLGQIREFSSSENGTNVQRSRPRATFPDSINRNVMQSCIVPIDLTGISGTINTANFRIDQIRWVSEAGDPPPDMHMARIPHANLPSGVTYDNLADNVSWINGFQNADDVDDPVNDIAWAGSGTDVDGQGARAEADDTTKVLLPWGGVEDMTTVQNSVTVFGFADMVQDAIDASEPVLLLLLYYEGPNELGGSGAPLAIDGRHEAQFVPFFGKMYMDILFTA